MDTTELPGRRERKKRATRDAIYIAARTLFMKKGFDAVTVAEIAEAADVSEKTVFNHFATKEDLALAGGEERLAKTVEALKLQVPGRAGDRRLPPHDRRPSSTRSRSIRSTRSWRSRGWSAGRRRCRTGCSIGWEREAATLTPAVRRRRRASPKTTSSRRVVARTLAWTNRLIFRRGLRRPAGR